MKKVIKEINKLKDKEIVILYTEPGVWTEAESQDSVDQADYLIEGLKKLGLSASSRKIRKSIYREIRDLDAEKTIIFNWCEGLDDHGFDYWKVPHALDKMKFAYTGNGPKALKLTEDKQVMKDVMTKNGIPTPKGKFFPSSDDCDWQVFPAIVKPVSEHCSNGIDRKSVVDNVEQLKRRIDELINEFGHGVLVEEFIDGMEYNVPMWGNGHPEVLPIVAIDYSKFSDYHDRIYGYVHKWDEESLEMEQTLFNCPADIEKDLLKKIEEVAALTYKVFKCRGYVRLDTRVRDGVPYVLDINPNPDIGMESDMIAAAQSAGYSYPEAIVKLLGIAYDYKWIYKS